jgi:hypothetical protein
MDLRYPIGRFVAPATIDAAVRATLVAQIATAPAELAHAVDGLTDAQLDTPYRDGGWTARQVVHHVADSHLNAYVRFKLALTEDLPTIRPYDEGAWAELPEARALAVDVSLALLAALHRRWVSAIESTPEAAFARRFQHPEWQAPMSLDTQLAIYAWHGRHHAAHITTLRAQRGWT